MASFDVSANWTIRFPPAIRAAQKGGEELALVIDTLRKHAGLNMALPALADGSSPSLDGPLIALNAAPGEYRHGAFLWRLSPNRLEIFGAGGRGICNGIFDFLSALNLRWDAPGAKCAVPRPLEGGMYLLARKESRSPSPSSPVKRLVFTGKESGKSRERLIIWAARNRYDALIFPLHFTAHKAGSRKSPFSLALDYDLPIERGGRELSRLLPRRCFWFHRDMFRMERGKRIRAHHFCATNPRAIAVLRQEAERLFRACPGVSVFHLWPDQGHEQTWCSCPSCRAFSPEEQNRIAVNAAAEVLAHINPEARLSYYERPNALIDLEIWPNTFKLEDLPAVYRKRPGNTG
ncbi:MAG: DUF4838 domain-containing protein [Treponema sp.]|jgi:hypothetical protein|nr:DUF4838 domain-containing protein [Treponema sp.]